MSRILNKLVDSNQEKRFLLIDTVCSDNSEVRIEELRSFISIMYLGNPPRGSMFNSNGTPKPKKDVCTFLKKNGGKIVNLFTQPLKVLGKLAVNAITTGEPFIDQKLRKEYIDAKGGKNMDTIKYKVLKVKYDKMMKSAGEKQILGFFLITYGIGRTHFGRIFAENRKALEKNVTFMNALELQMSTQSAKLETRTDKDLQLLRKKIMIRKDFTVYMLLDATGKLRNYADIVKAEKIMTKKRVREQVLRYNNNGNWLGAYAHQRKTTASKNAKQSKSKTPAPAGPAR
jgi:hypothetical protein